MLLDNPTFLTSLATLYSSHQHASVFVTLKCAPSKSAILFRATSGSAKLSTLVASTDIQDFNTAYINIVKTSMTSLRKKERVKQVRRKKAKVVDKMVE
jgi:hypothetical protein